LLSTATVFGGAAHFSGSFVLSPSSAVVVSSPQLSPAAGHLRGAQAPAAAQLLPSYSRAAPAAPAAALLAGVAAAGAAAAFRSSRRRVSATARQAFKQQYSDEDWKQRVKFIEGDRAVFDVTIPKPLGLIPADFPNRPGVGVAKITPDGNTDLLNRSVIIDNEPGMWVLEGDEVAAVNGVSVEGQGLDKVGPLVKEAEGDSVTLTLVRSYLAGPVKCVFLPSGKVATMKRGVEINKAADIGVEDVSFSCKEGWCKSCWHTDPMFGIVYRACSAVSKKRPPPKNPRTIPEKWNSVVPLWLLNWEESKKWAAERREKRAAATA